MGFGADLETSSGVHHEIDLVARHEEALVVFELKNRHGMPPEKNDVVVFFAKILDYLSCTPTLLMREISPVFLSAATFEPTGLEACLGLGIHPVAPGLRPLPLLADVVRRMSEELRDGLDLPEDLLEDFGDLQAQVNRLQVALEGTWVSRRCGFQSETTIVVRSVGPFPTRSISVELRQANGDCTRLLQVFKEAKARKSG